VPGKRHGDTPVVEGAPVYVGIAPMRLTEGPSVTLATWHTQESQISERERAAKADDLANEHM
jgi:hypothetical protein